MRGKWLGWLTLAAGLLLTFGPHNLFTVCADHGHFMVLQNGNQVPMRCTWTANTAQALGVFLAVLGLIMVLGKVQNLTRLYSPIVALLGLLIVLLPLYVVPTCPNPDMACNLETKPTLIGVGVVLLVAGAFAYFTSRREAGTQAA